MAVNRSIARRRRELGHRLADALRRAGRLPDSVLLVGVTKQQPPEKIVEAAAAGLWEFGENYVQEWKQKRARIDATHPELSSRLQWHFIGHLQTNKVADVA
ncbi:MAG: YggS family pyridoxal phosphate enzyme, partial [Candidatus Binatia bacterium]